MRAKYIKSYTDFGFKKIFGLLFLIICCISCLPNYAVTAPDYTNVSAETEAKLLKLFHPETREGYLLGKKEGTHPYLSMQKILSKSLKKTIFIVRLASNYTNGNGGGSNWIIYSLFKPNSNFKLIQKIENATSVDLLLSPKQDKLLIRIAYADNCWFPNTILKVFDLKNYKCLYDSGLLLPINRKEFKWLNDSEVKYLELKVPENLYKSSSCNAVYQYSKKEKYIPKTLTLEK